MFITITLPPWASYLAASCPTEAPHYGPCNRNNDAASHCISQLCRARLFLRNLDKVEQRTRIIFQLTSTWPRVVLKVPEISTYSPTRSFIAKTLFSGGRCFLPSCLSAGNYGCSGRVVRGDRRRLQSSWISSVPLDRTEHLQSAHMYASGPSEREGAKPPPRHHTQKT